MTQRRRAALVALVALLIATASLTVMAVVRNHERTRPTAAFVGDSYTAGPGKWPSAVSAEQGWREVNLGRGGTGFRYQPPASQALQACGLSSFPNFNAMIPLVVQAQPDVVVVAGGRNDGGEDISSDITKLFATLRTDLPDAEIIAIEPFWDSTEYPGFMQQYGVLIKHAVESVEGTYVPCGKPLVGHPDLVQSDGIHPTPEGQQALAAAIDDYLKRSNR